MERKSDSVPIHNVARVAAVSISTILLDELKR